MASIISVALLGFCREVYQVRAIYKRSKIEGVRIKISFHLKSKNNLIFKFKLAFAVTWLGVIILNVDYGLYIAMATSLMLVIIQNQRYIYKIRI